MAPLVRMTVFIKKLDSITDEEFHRHWSTTHAQIALSLKDVQKYIVRYSQFHVYPEARSKLAALGMPMNQYDGGVDLWARSVEDLVAAFAGEDYKNILAPDELNFINTSETKMMIGYDEEHSVDGKIVT